MPFTVTLPKLSPTMEGGQIVVWHKKVGDPIAAGDLLLEVATDKASVEYNALDPGFLRTILVPAGQEAKVNQPIAVCSVKADEDLSGYEPQWGGGGAPPPAAAPSPPRETAPRTPTPSSVAPSSVAPSSVQRAPLPTAPPPAAPSPAASSPRSPSLPPLTGPLAGGPRVAISPYAKKLAAQHQLDPTTVKGTGPGGRVLARDLAQAQPLAAVAFGRHAEPALPAGSHHIENLSPMRRVIGERLLESKTTIPHFYVSMTVNASALTQLRAQLANWGLKVTVNDLVVRATALALRQHPEVNSGWDPQGPSIVRYETVDIAVAVAIPGGLITPILSNADYRHLGEISASVKQLAQRAKEGQLKPHEYQGGSFTISNLGMFGVDAFFPIINPPQAAILGVGGIQEAAIVREGRVEIGQQMQLSLAADHRVIDGAEAARFLRTLQTFLENPAGLVVG